MTALAPTLQRSPEACHVTGGSLDDECGCPPCLDAHQRRRLAKMAAGMARLDLYAEAAERAKKIANRLAPAPVHPPYDFSDGPVPMFARMIANGKRADKWNAIKRHAFERILAKVKARALLSKITGEA